MEKVLDKFLRYVAVETTSNPESESFPSANCEFDLQLLFFLDEPQIYLMKYPNFHVHMIQAIRYVSFRKWYKIYYLNL